MTMNLGPISLDILSASFHGSGLPWGLTVSRSRLNSIDEEVMLDWKGHINPAMFLGVPERNKNLVRVRSTDDKVVSFPSSVSDWNDNEGS